MLLSDLKLALIEFVRFQLARNCSRLTLVAFTAALVFSLAWHSASAQGTISIPGLQWQACTAASAAGLDCATAQVPLDYADPAGSTISLAVIRHRAMDPGNRIGTLFMNPGGPGGQGTQDLPAWTSLFSPTMLARFDIISWDPRGIGESTAVQCFANQADETNFFAGVPQDSFPVGLAQKTAWLQRFAAFGRICLERNGALLSHTSTADTARDLDLLRQAVGEQTLNYLGLSYGTFLGAVYANLFPNHVRTMILDGNIVPTLFTNDGDPDVALSDALRFGSAQGVSESLAAFLDQCGLAGTGKCAFSTGDAAGTHTKFDALLHRVKSTPVTYQGVEITYALLLKLMAGWLFTTRPEPGNFPGWIGAGAVLEALWNSSDSGNTAAPPASSATAPETQSMPDAGAEQKYTSNWQSLTVQCGDSPNPRPPVKFLALDRYAYNAYGPIGVVDLWADEPCSSWPVTSADQYIGPWDNPTPNTVLVIGNTHDPSTPYSNAVRLSQELANARLLTVEGYGHTVFLNPSQCAQQYEDAYLVGLTLPPEGTVCQQNSQPFD